MDINERISLFYQEYKADYEAARLAESRGNLEGARKLYRQAALDLCEMANLETGETRRQRTLHAEQVLEKAKSLSEPQQKTIDAASAPRAAAQAAQGGGEDDNPWQSEGIPDTTFDDVVGMEDVKELIRTRIIDQFRYPELYKAYGLRGGTGILLFGLPGTGKTTVARAIAHEIGAPLYTVLLSDVLNKWVGESEKRIRQLFDKARQTETALIFFDDFDVLGMERQDDGNHNNKIIVELINQMDGFRENKNTLILLAASNKPWMIDSALMRPGRFEHHIYVPLANHDARKLLVQKTLGGVPTEPDLDLDRVSDLMTGYNGADIVSVVKSAKYRAVTRSKAQGDRILPVSLEDFTIAADEHKSSVKPGDIEQLRRYAIQRGIELPDEM